MRGQLLIFTLFFCFTTNAQTWKEMEVYFGLESPTDDTSLNYYLSFLKTKYSKVGTGLFCEIAFEKIGDIYKSRKEYRKAIRYYDSSETKYYNSSEFCGNAHYIRFIPRRYKTSQCYFALNNPNRALAELTPYLFNNLGHEYFDSSMITYYVSLLDILYSKREIQSELLTALDKMEYSVSQRSTSEFKFISFQYKLQLFDSSIELHAFTTIRKDSDSSHYYSKEYAIKLLKSELDWQSKKAVFELKE